MNLKHRLFLLVCGLLSLGLPSIAAKPVMAAEALRVSYGQLEFSLSIASLTTFAETGELTGDLRFYARFLDAQALADLRQFLQQRFEVSPVVVSNVTYSALGERSLKRLGSVIRTDARQDGFFALRSAFILAANQPEGMSILNIIHNYPSPSIRINAAQLLALRRELQILKTYRDAALRAITDEMQSEIATNPTPNVAQLPNLAQPGPYQVSTRMLTLERDRQTQTGDVIQRTFHVDVYLPEDLAQPAPVVIISHGLGSSPAAFAYLGNHLASYGFAAVILQHLGSDATRQTELLTGILNSGVNPVEFIDRPLDIRYTLDQLEQLSQTDPEWQGRLNLQAVGAIGHSLGGYTVLALGGANLNTERLQQMCPPPALSLNAAPELQCLASQLPAFRFNLQDPRIKAIMAISPIDSVALGPENLSKIQIPTLLMGGSRDFIASVIEEQIHPFTWLTTPDKYLAITIPSSHNSADASDGDLDPPPNSVNALLAGPAPTLGREYIRELSLAFMQTYLAHRSDYQPYLSPEYARSISQDPLQLTFVRQLTPAQLEAAYGRTPPIPIVPPLAEVPVPRRATPILQEVAQTGVLKAVIRQDALPFGSVDANGQPQGFCVELLNSFTNYLGQQIHQPIKLDVTALSTVATRFAHIQDGSAHVECGPDTIRRDVRGVTFSTPFFLSGTQFLLPIADAGRISPLATLADVRVGVVEGTRTEQFVQNQYPNANLVLFGGTEARSQGLQALQTGAIDILAGDGALLAAEATRQNLLPDKYTLAPSGPLTCEPYGLVLPNNDPQWEDTVNQFISQPSFRQLWTQQFGKQAVANLFLNLDFCAGAR